MAVFRLSQIKNRFLQCPPLLSYQANKMERVREELKPELRVDVTLPGVQSAYAEAPLEEGKSTLEKAGYEIISGEINAGLRIQKGKKAHISQNGNYIREDLLYVPERFGKRAGVWIPKESLVLQYLTEAVNAHRNRREFYVTEEQAEESLKGAVRVPGDSIPVKELVNDEAAARIFGKNTKDYGLFLKDADIDSVIFGYCSLEEIPFANQLWFDGLVGCGRLNRMINLSGWESSLDFLKGVRGIKRIGKDLSSKL